MEESEIKESGEQSNNRPWLYKKGQSGNPKGRPKGISLKEYAKLKFVHMTDEEKEEFFDGLDKKTIWSMAEGNPDTKSEVEIVDKVDTKDPALQEAIKALKEKRLKE